MKRFTYTVDDNIIFFKQISERNYVSIFEHPYLAMYKRLHEKYGLKVQLNLFYECEDFNLSMFSDRYINEWKNASDWLKLSFHSKNEDARPYEFSGYDEVYNDCRKVNDEIVRFASEASLATTTTVHYCLTTEEGNKALADNGIKGLLGLYGKEHTPSVSYCRTSAETEEILTGKTVTADGIAYAALDIVLNLYSKEEIIRRLDRLYGRDLIKIMIHEQYFHKEHRAYQMDFEEKLDTAFAALYQNGYQSVFFEDTI